MSGALTPTLRFRTYPQFRMRSLIRSLGLASTLLLTVAGSALGHVHGITPLRCVGVADDGANRVDDTPRVVAVGGPVGGLIPRAVGSRR